MSNCFKSQKQVKLTLQLPLNLDKATNKQINLTYTLNMKFYRENHKDEEHKHSWTTTGYKD